MYCSMCKSGKPKYIAIVHFPYGDVSSPDRNNIICDSKRCMDDLTEELKYGYQDDRDVKFYALDKETLEKILMDDIDIPFPESDRLKGIIKEVLGVK